MSAHLQEQKEESLIQPPGTAREAPSLQRNSPAPVAAGDFSFLSAAEFSQPVNDAEKVRILGAMQQQHGNLYLQRALAANQPASSGSIVAAPIQAGEGHESSAAAGPDSASNELAIERGSGGPLDDQTRSFMESRFGSDFSSVRIHTDAQAQQATSSLGAEAFTAGRDIYFNQAAYAPSSPRGRGLIAHELAHVVQQGRATTSAGRLVSDHSDPAEVEAEILGRQTQQSEATQDLRPSAKPAAFIHRCHGRTPGATATAAAPTTRQSAAQVARPEAQPPTAGPAAPAQVTQPPATPGLSPEATRQLLYATTTLRHVPPMSAGDRAMLERVIPGVQFVSFIAERDRKLGELARVRDELERVQPASGVPLPGSSVAQSIDTLNQRIEVLNTDIGRLNRLVQAGLQALHLARESDLVALVTEQFPRRFVERAKQIAIAELNQNQLLAEREAERYGVRLRTPAGPPAFTPYEMTGGRARGVRLGNPADRAGLRLAARDLATRTREIAEAQASLQLARSDVDMPSGGMPDPAHMSSSYYDVRHLGERIAQQTAELETQRRVYRVQYPILQQSLDLQAVSTASDAQLESLVGDRVRLILDNIAETRGNVDSGRLKIWNLNNIVAMTVQDLGIGSNAALMALVNQHIESEQTAETVLAVGLAALSLTAGIVAALATGGLAMPGLAAAASGVGLAAGGYQAYQHLQEYRAETAASNVALDPRVADISRGDPDLFWLVVDIAGVVFDAVQVVQAFNRLRGAARSLMETGRAEEFIQAANDALPRAAAARVIASASRQSGVGNATVRAIEAIGVIFRRSDLRRVERLISEVADSGVAEIVRRLTSRGRVVPLTEDALVTYLGNTRAADLITRHRLFARNTQGLFDNGFLFIKPGELQAVSTTLIHETSHYLQGIFRMELLSFDAEFQAFAMQRDFLLRLEREGGREFVPAVWRWLSDATDDVIASHIRDSYGYRVPSAYDGEQAVETVMTLVHFITGP